MNIPVINGRSYELLAFQKHVRGNLALVYCQEDIASPFVVVYDLEKRNDKYEWGTGVYFKNQSTARNYYLNHTMEIYHDER